MKLPLTLLALYFLISPSFADRDSTLRVLISRVEHLDDRADKIALLDSCASLCLNYCNDIQRYDSLHEVAIGIAETSFDDQLILESLSNYLNGIEENYTSPELVQRIERLVALAEKTGDEAQIFNSWIVGAGAAVKAIRVNSEVQQIAQRLALKAQNKAYQKGDQEMLLESGIHLARALLYQDKIAEAFQQMLFLKSMVLSLPEKDQREKWMYHLNGALSDFYYMTKDWDEAGSYKRKQIEHLMQVEPVDSHDLMWKHYDLLVISHNAKRIKDEQVFNDILGYAKRSNNDKLRDWVLTVYRNHLIKSEKFDELKDLYQIRYPEELVEMKKKEPILYCLVMGSICEEENVDSSFHFYSEAERLLASLSEKNMASMQYKRLGKINERFGHLDKARSFYETSYELARDVSNETFALQSLEALEMLTLKQEDFEAAYKYSKLREETLANVMDWKRQKSLMRMAFNNEELINRIKDQNKYKEKKERHSRQNWLIAIILALAILAMMMMTTMPVAEWVIEMMAFFTILCIFEFVILTIDHELHYATEGAPLPMFGAKVLLLSVLFPLHHVIENGVVNFMKKRKRLKQPEESAPFTIKRTVKKALGVIWPWLDPDRNKGGH